MKHQVYHKAFSALKQTKKVTFTGRSSVSAISQFAELLHNPPLQKERFHWLESENIEVTLLRLW